MDRLEEQILDAAITEFSEKGLKFTMDDVSRRLHVSKKTIYKIYDTKEAMFLAIADYCFADIKQREHEIARDQSLDVVEKLRRIMIVLPERYQNIGLSSLYQLKEKFPKVYAHVETYLSTDWDETVALLQQGMEEGRIRKLPVPIIQTMFESTIQAFFSSAVLVENGITYEQAMEEVIEILLTGICTGK